MRFPSSVLASPPDGSSLSIDLAYFLEGKPKYVLRRDRPTVEIDDNFRKCVAFLGCEKEDKTRPIGGTVCFFSFALSPAYCQWYAVTARHVIEGLKKNNPDSDMMFMRVNMGNGTQEILMDKSKWTFHTDDTVDVAVMPFDVHKGMDHKAYPLENNVTEERIRTKKIGIGCELFVTGLFTHLVPTEKNVPILRTGSIAAMPEVPIMSDGRRRDAYLAEVRSIGGLSGSPVFAYLNYRFGGSRGRPDMLSPEIYILGIIHGHYQNKNVGASSLEPESINSGIAIVTPIQKVLEVLNLPEFVKDRESELRRITAENDMTVLD